MDNDDDAEILQTHFVIRYLRLFLLTSNTHAGMVCCSLSCFVIQKRDGAMKWKIFARCSEQFSSPSQAGRQAQEPLHSMPSEPASVFVVKNTASAYYVGTKPGLGVLRILDMC